MSFSKDSTEHALNSSDQVSANTTPNLNDSYKYKGAKREEWKSKGLWAVELQRGVPSIVIGFIQFRN